jgi:iron complex outermembrane receptor protein
MKLNTYIANVRWIKPLGEVNELILGGQGTFQTNTNAGTRVLIPNATVIENSVYAFMKHDLKKIVIEEGVRFNAYSLSTVEHGNKDSLISASDAWMPAISRSFPTFSAAVGFAWSPTEPLLFKLNLSSGYRAPNLGELCFNGFHEGFVYYEQGDNTLGKEQNAEADLSVRYGTGDLKIEVAGYYNMVRNFIYIAPSDSFYSHRFIYFHRQTDALLAGGEAGFDWEPSFAKWLDLKCNYSTLTATDKDKNYLPLMPADRVNGEVMIRFRDGKKRAGTFAKAGMSYVLEQWKIAESEFSTPAYVLVDLSFGSTFSVKETKLEVSLFCTNLLNAYYYDHLSLVKPGTMPGGLGFYGMGRNIGAVIKLPFGK